MQIHIKKLDGQKEEFSLEPNDSVMKVKVSAAGRQRGATEDPRRAENTTERRSQAPTNADTGEIIREY